MTRLDALPGGNGGGSPLAAPSRGVRAEAREIAPPAPRSRAWRWIALAILIAPAAIGLVVLLASSGGPGETLGPVRGLRLGLSPSQARQMFTPEQAGTYATSAMGEDFALEWIPAAPSGALRGARLEFHLGQLVALRLSLAPDAPEARGSGLEASEASLLTREPSPEGGVELTWLARSCPTHADEVRRRIAEHR